MTTSALLAALRAHSDRPLVFRAGAELVPPGYHLTEVKRVSYETMDCGAMTHRWNETQFEIWVPAREAAARERGHMPAGKFLGIVDRVEARLPLQPEALARIHASFGDQPAALYDVERVALENGQLRIDLTPDRTRCKAAERRACLVPGGGDGNRSKEPAGGTATGCGCRSPQHSAPEAACCA